MQGFSIESKTSGICSSSTSWQDLDSPVCNEANLTPRSPGTKPEKMTNSEDLAWKVSNLARQGATSNSERNWRQEPTCRKGKDLEDSGTDTGQRRESTGPRWAQAGQPSSLRVQVTPPLTWPPFGLFIALRPRAMHQSIRHRTSKSREERDTISERRWSS
jgi:hypothetical protein